jgi:hypothetical protein
MATVLVRRIPQAEARGSQCEASPRLRPGCEVMQMLIGTFPQVKTRGSQGQDPPDLRTGAMTTVPSLGEASFCQPLASAWGQGRRVSSLGEALHCEPLVSTWGSSASPMLQRSMQ